MDYYDIEDEFAYQAQKESKKRFDRRTSFTVYDSSWGTKMYRDLKEHFWWNNMKRDVAEFVFRCLVCQKVKLEHKHPGGLLQLPIAEWKWDNVAMDFVVELPKIAGGKNAIWVIIDRLTNCTVYCNQHK